MKVQASVICNPRAETATLLWSEWLGETRSIEDFGNGPEEIVIPHHGRVLASTVRPHAEFHDRDPLTTPLTAYVEQHLPPPANCEIRRF